jgi:predicted dehydrogenase
MIERKAPMSAHTDSAFRVAIIGSGMIGTVHRDAARAAGAEVIGVLGSSPDRSHQVAAEWGVARGYADIDELLRDRPDVVHVCTPNDTHFTYSQAVIAAGIHIICEKPLAISTAQAQELADAAHAANVIATVPFVYRYHPLVREIRARRASGELGDIKLIHGSYLQDWLHSPHASSWRVDPATSGRSRAFADIGSHWCDLAEFVSGDRFTSVSAASLIAHPERPASSGPSFSGGSQSDRTVPVTTEDAATATFKSRAGILANTVISQISGGRKNRLWIELDGTVKSAVFDQENPEQIWLGTENGAEIIRRGEGDLSAAQRRLHVLPAGHGQGYLHAFRAFIDDTYDAINGASPDGLPTFADGLRSAKIIDAVLDSAA